MTGYKKIRTKAKRRNKRDSGNMYVSQFLCMLLTNHQKAVTFVRCIIISFSIPPLFLISLWIFQTLQRLFLHVKLKSASNTSMNHPAKNILFNEG